MKSYTTPEQSKRLRDLGIDVSMAEMSFVSLEHKDYTEDYYTKVPFNKQTSGDFNDIFDGTPAYTKTVLPVFKFKTLLSMLPVRVNGTDGKKYMKLSDGTSIRYSIVKTDHDGVPFEDTYKAFSSRSKYVNIYDMACWLLENKLMGK